MFIMFNHILNSEMSVTNIVQNISIGKITDECLYKLQTSVSTNFRLLRFCLLVLEYLKPAHAIYITRWPLSTKSNRPISHNISSTDVFS